MRRLVVMGILLLVESFAISGCASGAVRLGKDPVPPESRPARYDTVFALWCLGDLENLNVYFSAKRTDEGTKVEMMTEARKQQQAGKCPMVR